ncbi:hypothetical protein ABDI04_05260 [Bacillus licheniformis]
MDFVSKMVKQGRQLNDEILNRDLDSILEKYEGFNFKSTVLRLENAFNDACYRGVYDALKLEMECKDII